MFIDMAKKKNFILLSASTMNKSGCQAKIQRKKSQQRKTNTPSNLIHPLSVFVYVCANHLTTIMMSEC